MACVFRSPSVSKRKAPAPSLDRYLFAFLHISVRAAHTAGLCRNHPTLPVVRLPPPQPLWRPGICPRAPYPRALHRPQPALPPPCPPPLARLSPAPLNAARPHPPLPAKLRRRTTPRPPVWTVERVEWPPLRKLPRRRMRFPCTSRRARLCTTAFS
jgi:hypothetical protein